MKNQVLVSSKDKRKKKIKMSSAAIFVWRFLWLKLIPCRHVKVTSPFST